MVASKGNVAVIAARMASTRLPGKPLADICGKPMIQWVYERACGAKLVDDVIIATPDNEVIEVAKTFGGKAFYTSPLHQSGTDRLAEVAENLDCRVMINVQGDEPLLRPENIDLIAKAMQDDESTQMASLMREVPREEAENPNLVKVVVDTNGYALYFSRSLIPYIRNESKNLRIFGHIGLYAYRRDFLMEFAAMPQTMLELSESLEQLRAIENGCRIKMIEVMDSPIGVDTPEDLERVRKVLEGVKD
jgi:3-deoxy-manno-octulosonate cytidylyltransferase (CMP-KDO synthetase)